MRKDEESVFRRMQAIRFPMHSCELPPVPDRIFPQLPPNATMWQRCRRTLQHQLVGWRKSRPLRAMRPSNMQFEYEQAHHARSRYWWVIHPMSRFYMLWQILVITSILSALCTEPVMRAFGYWRLALGSEDIEDYMLEWGPIDPLEVEKFKERVLILEDALKTCSSVETLIYWIHIVVKFNTGFVDRQTNRVEMNPLRIVKRYLKTTFVIDILSCGLYLDEGINRVLFNTLYFPVMITQKGKIFRIICYSLGLCVLLRVYELFCSLNNWFEFLNVTRVVSSFLFFTLIYFLFMHWMACLSIFIPLQVQGKSLFRSDSTSWLNARNFFMLYANVSFGDKYLASLCRVVRISRGDVIKNRERGTNTEDFILVLTIIWCSSIFVYIIIALIVHNLGTRVRAEIKYPQVMQEVQNYMRQRKLPVYLRYKILLYYSHVLQGRYLNPRAVLANMPLSMREAIKSSNCHRLVAGSLLFRNVPKSLVVSVIECLREEMYLPHDVVYTSKSDAHSMFFLNTGTVALLAPTGEEVGHLDDGAYFGEMELVSHMRRRIFSVVALEVCEMFLLGRGDFRRLFKPHPRLYNRLRAISMQRASELLEWDEMMRRDASDDESEDDVDKNADNSHGSQLSNSKK